MPASPGLAQGSLTLGWNDDPTVMGGSLRVVGAGAMLHGHRRYFLR
jgi:hypothetical protein